MNETYRFGFLKACGFGSEGRTNPRVRRYELTFLSQRKRLYHYTNLAGLKGIVEDNGIWANHVAYMNDAEEVLHGRNLAIEVLTRLLDKRRYHNGFQEVLQKVVEQFRSAELPDLYVTCFSMNGDSLDQWRGYCKRGAGVSIGFDLSHSDPFNLLPLMNLADVVYGRQAQIRRIVLWVQRFAREYELDVAHHGRLPSFEYSHHIHYIEYLSAQLENLFVAFKNPAFVSEEETRLIIHGSRHTLFEKKHARATDYFFVPYFLTSDIKVKTECGERLSDRPLPVDEIIVGPSPHSELTKRSVEAFLQERQIKASVRISKIPFRNFT